MMDDSIDELQILLFFTPNKNRLFIMYIVHPLNLADPLHRDYFHS